MPPGRRCFARIDRFECECPHCGRLIFAGIDKRFLPSRLADTARARAAAKQRPKAESILRLFWNPYTQRLCCPWCDHVYTLGVVFYPARRRGRRITQPAPDTEPTPAEVAEMRRLAGGWFVQGGKTSRLAHLAHANLLVTAECSCVSGGTDPACLLHGAALIGVNAAPRSEAPEGGESPK
jgi:hypothetical protein